jgi:hypothetical protein
MTIRPCPDRARAWWGDQLIADSSRALRVDEPGGAPSLWFPWDDVRADSFRSAGTESSDEAELERFDATGPAPERRHPARWGDPPDVARDGIGVLRRCLTPPPGLEALRGCAVVDHGQADVEVVDAVEGGHERDATIKRFPNWGDADELVAVLDGQTVICDHQRPVVEGSQLLGQAIVAAMRHSPGRRVVSAHMLFLRAADAGQPVELVLDPVTNGRTFTSCAAHVDQAGRRCAAGTLLLGVPSVDVVRHAEPVEGVPGPYDAVPHDMGVTGRDLRVVDRAYTDDPDAPLGPPAIDAWVRFRRLPDDRAIHAGLLAQFTGHMSIAAALRPHSGVGGRPHGSLGAVPAPRDGRVRWHGALGVPRPRRGRRADRVVLGRRDDPPTRARGRRREDRAVSSTHRSRHRRTP